MQLSPPREAANYAGTEKVHVAYQTKMIDCNKHPEVEAERQRIDQKEK
jgi:hypothetical protein